MDNKIRFNESASILLQLSEKTVIRQGKKSEKITELAKRKIKTVYN